MENKNKKTILKTMGGVAASSLLISSILMQPTGSLKQAVDKYEESIVANEIQKSILEQKGDISTPHITKTLTDRRNEMLVNRALDTPFDIPKENLLDEMVPDYVSPGHQTDAYDVDGRDFDVIQQEQSASREITLSNGEQYTEMYGFQDDLGNYMDELPALASVGVVNEPGVGLESGFEYTKYNRSSSRAWRTFNTKVSPNAVHGSYNYAPSDGPAIIYDGSTNTMKTVVTNTVGQTGDGSDGYWRHSKTYEGNSFPRSGINPTFGNWGYTAFMGYAGWLFDWHVGSTSYWYTSYNAHNWMWHNGWGGSYGNGNQTVSRSEFLQMVARAYSLGYVRNFFWSFAFNRTSGHWGNNPTMYSNPDHYNQIYIWDSSFNNLFGGQYGGGDISWISSGDQSWDMYSGERDNEWKYYGYTYYSASPTSGTDIDPVYGKTTNYWSSSSGDEIWDNSGVFYEEWPRNAEKVAVPGWNYTETDTRAGVGDESGRYYYTGTRTAYTNQPMTSLFTENNAPGFDPDGENFKQVGDGSGRTYERALYYYDKDGNMIHDLPSDEFIYTGDAGNLFNTVDENNTFSDNEDLYEGVTIGKVVEWISANQDTFSIDDEFLKNTIGIDFVVTETDTKQKRILIAIQSAISFLAGASSQTEMEDALILFSSVVDMSATDRGTIVSYVNSVSTSSITSKLQEGHRQNTISYFNETVEIFGEESVIDAARDLLDGDELKDWFAISSGINVIKIDSASGIEYVYVETTDTIAEEHLKVLDVSLYIDTKDVILPEDLTNTHAKVNDWIYALDDRAAVTYVRYSDFDYDKKEIGLEVYVTIGAHTRIYRSLITFENSYMDIIMRELAIDELTASTGMLAEQPLLTSAEYTIGDESDIGADTASFALYDSFKDKFPKDVELVNITQLTPPTEEQTVVDYEFTIEYEGHQRTFLQSFTFAKTRSQKYVEDAIASITEVNSTVSIYDKNILDLTSRTETFQPFIDFLVADGNTAARMTFDNILLVGGGDIDRDASQMQFVYDIHMGGYSLPRQTLTLNLNHSINQELIDNLTQDELVATSPGIVTIVDEFDGTTPEWDNSAWWTIQSSWLQMIDIAGIAVLGNFQKIDERHFSVDLEVTIGTVKKTINVTQKVGFNLNFADVLDESTTGISDPDTLAAFREYMLRFDEQSSVYYLGNFEHGFIARDALASELLQAWQGTVSTLAGDAVVRSVEITDTTAISKYDREVSFRITLEDSNGNTRTFDKVHTLPISAVAAQFRDATANMLSTTQNLAGELSDTVMVQMQNIADYTWLTESLGLLDTVRVVSVTNTGKTAHVIFEFGYSGHLGDDSKQVSIDYVFDRRGDKDLALSMYGLGYTEAELSTYYDINNVDASGNDWKNVEQLVLENLIKSAAQSQLRDDLEDEINATHTSITPNVWADQVALRAAIDAITTTDIMTILQAEITAGGITRTIWITTEMNELRNEKMEYLILSDLANNWKLNSTAEALNEIIKYNNTFDIQDFYLADVVTVVENATFAEDIALDIAHDALLSHVLDTTLYGVSDTSEIEYHAAITAATNNAFNSEYANNVSGTWTNIDEFIALIADSTSQIIIDNQITASLGVLNSTTHYNDRTINQLVKDLTIFTDEEIKIVAYDVENAGTLDKDSASFNIEVFLTFGSIVNQRHVLRLDLDKSIHQAILDQIDSGDIEIKDFLVKELADELELEHYGTWDKFGISSGHILPTDGLQGSVDASSFTIIGDATTSPDFSLDFTFTLGTTSRTITSDLRIGMDIIFDLAKVSDPSDTVLLDYLRGYDVAQRVVYSGTWLHPYEMIDASDSELNSVLNLYSGLAASGVQINDIYIHNKDNISEFTRLLTLKIVAEDNNGDIKVFDKVITFGASYAEWAFSDFDETKIALVSPDILNGMLTDGIKTNILGEKSGYVITDQRSPIHIDDPVVRHLGKTATISWRVWYDDGLGTGSSNSKVIEIDYEFASRGSKDEALAQFGLGYSDDPTGINIDWNNVDGTNDWTNVEQNVLDELVRGLAETKIRADLNAQVFHGSSDYVPNVWATQQDLDDEILLQTDIYIIGDLALNIYESKTTRQSFIESVTLNIQRTKIEDNIIGTIQTRWGLSSQEETLNLINQLNAIIDVATYYQHDMHTVISTSTFALDIARQMEIDSVRNAVSEIITVGLAPTDPRYTIYNDVLTDKLDSHYDTQQASGFADVNGLIRQISDSISQEAIDDLLLTISSSIDGTLDKDTRVLADVHMNLQAFDQAGILHSNIDVVNGNPMDHDLLAIPLSFDLTWGSVSNDQVNITMNLNKTVSQAMIDEIKNTEIGLIDPRLAPTVADVVAADLTADQFAVFSRHILGSDALTLTINTASFTPDPIEPREFTMDVTITIGAETRIITILASVGFDIDLDWQNIDLDNATSAEQDMFDFMSSYNFQKETEFFSAHTNPWQLRDESDLLSQFSVSRNLSAARGEFIAATLTDPTAITKYTRSVFVTITVQDKNGVTYQFDREVIFGESYIEATTKAANESHFDIVSSIQLTNMLTDDTITEMESLSAYYIDTLLDEFDVVELLTLQQSGKTATATFRISYNDGAGYSGSKIISKDFVFASRGSKDEAVSNFGLGYSDSALGIDWDIVDSIGNDWTNVEQSTLDQLVSSTSYDRVRLDIRNTIVFDSAGYIDNVFGSVAELDAVVNTFATNAELKDLQALITDNIKTRAEWLAESKTFIEESNVESMILEALTSEWKLFDASAALAKAEELFSGFNIRNYYAQDIHTLVTNATFDADQARQIGYDVFHSITRDHMNVFHTDVNDQREIHYDNIHSGLFETKFDENINGGWTQLTEFSKLVADTISRQFIDDEIAKLTTSSTGYPTIQGFVDLNTRMLNDIRKDFSALELQYIDVSNIRLTSNGTTIGGDLPFEQIYGGLSYGSVVVDDLAFTLEFDQTINYAIMEAISADDIRMTEYLLTGSGTGVNGGLTTADVDPADILAWMFSPLSSHIRGSDAISVSLDSANPFTPHDVASDPYLRKYSIGITLTLGTEVRTFHVEERLGHQVVFGTIDSSRWDELGIIDADDEADYIAYNDAYPYVNSISYLENFEHALDVQSATEQEWMDSLSKSLYLIGAKLTIASVQLKDAGTYTKYDKEFTFIMNLQDSEGAQRVFEKTITLANSAVEHAMLEASEATFAFTHHDNTTAMLTDDTLQNILTDRTSFFIDSEISQYLDISDPIVEYSGKTATVGFKLSYNDGAGNIDSRVIQIDVVFASRGSKDDAMANYSLGYDNLRLGIDWNTVDAFANDWTNVEQEVLDNLVKVASQVAVRIDINDGIIASASEYITNVWTDQLALSDDVDAETTYILLAELQAEILAGNTDKDTYITNLIEILKIDKIEALLADNMAALWRISDPSNVETRALTIKSDFDIKDYYLSNKDGIIQSANFVDTISYDAFEDIYREDIDYSMLASANAGDEAYVTTAIDSYINEKIREVFALNVWTNDSTIVSHASHLISAQAIDDALESILHGSTNNSTLIGQITRDTRNIDDVNIDWAPLTSAGLYLSNLQLHGSVDGEFVDRDTTVLPSSISITFGTILDTDYSVDVQINETLNQAIISSLTSTSITLRHAKRYADVDFMLNAMNETATITNASYFESAVDFMGADDATIALDPAAPLVRDPDSGRIFTIGLIVTAGAETRNLEIRVQVGESIDFSLPEFSLGGSFDFNEYFVMTTSVFDNPYDLHQIGDDAINHIGIDPFLVSSFVSVQSIIIEGNGAVDIFSRQYVATFVLEDRLGRTRTFTDQPVVIPGASNKAEKIMAAVDSSQILLDDANILNGQLTDEMLQTTLFDLGTYSFGNELNLLNDLQVKEVTHTGKHATVTFIVGYDDGNGATDHIEYTYNYEFAYRADVAYSLDYYGLAMTVDQLRITFNADQASGNVEQDEVDALVIAGITWFLSNKSEQDLDTFVDADIFTSTELAADITAFFDNDKIEAVAIDGQSFTRDEVLLQVKQEVTALILAKSFDIVAADFLKAQNWNEVSAKYPDVTDRIEDEIAKDIAADTFDAKDIQAKLGYEIATKVAPQVENIAINGTSNVDGWLLALIGEAKNGFLWIAHSTILDQLRTGFDDAPLLSPETSGIHVNENSNNGWFVDEIANLTSFADMDSYLEHLSGKIARFEIPAEITSAHLSAARIVFENNLVSVLQSLIDDGTMTYQDINAYLDVVLYVDHDHPQGYPDANFDAIFSPAKYYTDNASDMLLAQFDHSGEARAKEAGMLNITALLAKDAIYIDVNNADLEVEHHTAIYSSVTDIAEFRHLHEHYIFMLRNNVYEDAYEIYRADATSNRVSNLEAFLVSYVSRMDVRLSGLEGIDYLDQDNLDTQAALIARRVDQIQNMPDIEGLLDKYINNIGLLQSEVDDSPYRDILQFTITHDRLESHLYDQALILILEPGAIFDQVVDQFTNRPSDRTIADAKVLLDDLMTQAYPVDEIDLDLTIKSAILFANVNEEYYQEIVDIYNAKVAIQDPNGPTWNATTNTEEARASMAPVIERIFGEIKDGFLDLDTAVGELEDSKEEVAIFIAWTKYEEVFIDIFNYLSDINPQIGRISFEELEEYVTDWLGEPSIEFYIQAHLDIDKIEAITEVPDTLTLLGYVQAMVVGVVGYADFKYDELINHIAEISKLTVEEVLDHSSIVDDVTELDVESQDPISGDPIITVSAGGTLTEIKALRANIGMYVFELMMNASVHPDPAQNINGWLIPFAALITKTDDYSKITEIITDKVNEGEALDFENWGFEGIADIMNTLIDTSTPQDSWNTESGKIVMDKFVRSDESSSNAWSTTMWLGPVPIRMTYGNDGDISKMQTVLMDREDPETIKTIGLSTKYNAKEMTLRLGMNDGTTVYIRYVEDADGHTNIILERLDTSTNTWLSSEMYRERDLEQGIERKTYDIFRDSNMATFHGSPSEFEEGIIQIYPQQSSDAKAQASNADSTIEHVWGANPTTDSSTDTGDATSAPVIVSKDDEGNTHIQLHLKDMKIANTSASMTAVITAGGFTLMWLFWTFLIGLASVGASVTTFTTIFVKKKNRKRRFVNAHPEYKGASLRNVLALQKLFKEKNKLRSDWEKAKDNRSERAEPSILEDQLALKTASKETEFLALESLVLAEAEAAKFGNVFKGDVKTINKDGLEYSRLERAAMASKLLEQRTFIANQLNGGKFVENKTQEFMVSNNNKTIERGIAPVSVRPERINPPEELKDGPTRRSIENGLYGIQTLKTTALHPMPTKPREGLDLTPITKLGAVISSVSYKRPIINKNKKEVMVSILLNLDGKNVTKDVKVAYKYSINENIMRNIDQYNVDVSGLQEFRTTRDPKFTYGNIMNSFKISAPGARVVLKRGSLKILGDTEYAGKLKISIGTLVTVIPFKAQL